LAVASARSARIFPREVGVCFGDRRQAPVLAEMLGKIAHGL
jgi:hypothetical protein